MFLSLKQSIFKTGSDPRIINLIILHGTRQKGKVFFMSRPVIGWNSPAGWPACSGGLAGIFSYQTGLGPSGRLRLMLLLWTAVAQCDWPAGETFFERVTNVLIGGSECVTSSPSWGASSTTAPRVTGKLYLCHGSARGSRTLVTTLKLSWSSKDF